MQGEGLLLGRQISVCVAPLYGVWLLKHSVWPEIERYFGGRARFFRPPHLLTLPEDTSTSNLPHESELQVDGLATGRQISL